MLAWAEVGSAGTSSLKSLAESKGMRFGSAVSDGPHGSFNDPQYAAVLEADCDLLVPENELKWQALRPAEGQFDFSRFDRILAHARAAGMAMRGHNLLWARRRWMPQWLERHDFGARPATEADRLLRAHITTVCSRYRGVIASYDVVNEVVLPRNGVLARTALSTAFGGAETMVDQAFRIARESAPDAQLVYNDYMSWEEGQESHRAGVLRLLERLRKRGTPVDALGVQSHLAAGKKAQERQWRQFVDEVVGMNYGILITEFDVNDQLLPAPTEERDAATAAVARAYFDLMLSYRQLRDVLSWGMCDGASWLQTFAPLRRDGLRKRGCLYDEAFKPKPLHAAVAAALAAAPSRA
jgi:endo-1,4-beta-xylanase